MPTVRAVELLCYCLWCLNAFQVWALLGVDNFHNQAKNNLIALKVSSGCFRSLTSSTRGFQNSFNVQPKRCWSVVTPGRFALQLLIPPQRWVFAQFNGRAEEESFQGPSGGGIPPTHYDALK